MLKAGDTLRPHKVLRGRFVTALVAINLCYSGLIIMESSADTTPSYDLTLDNIPVNMADEKTLYLDTQTYDRSFVIHDDHVQVRSAYLTFYDLNNSYEHEDTNLVIGDYCYATIPGQNATLDTIRPIDRFRLSSSNGTVTASTTSYSTKRMALHVNSSENASLLIQGVDLDWPHRYRVFIDGVAQEDALSVSHAGIIEYNYSGPWSNHTIIFSDMGAPIIVPSAYLNLIQLFLILGLFVTVAKVMILPVISNKNVPSKVVTKNLIQAAIYIAVGLGAISLVFNLFIGG